MAILEQNTLKHMIAAKVSIDAAIWFWSGGGSASKTIPDVRDALNALRLVEERLQAHMGD